MSCFCLHWLSFLCGDLLFMLVRSFVGFFYLFLLDYVFFPPAVVVVVFCVFVRVGGF